MAAAVAAASVDAVHTARASDVDAAARAKKMLSNLERECAASGQTDFCKCSRPRPTAPVKKYQGAVALEATSARFTKAPEASMPVIALAIAGVIPKGPNYAEIMRQVAPFNGLASSFRPSVTKVSDKAAEVEQRLSDAVRRDVDADELGSMDPVSTYGSCE